MQDTKSTSSVRVLVVDDCPDTCKSMAILLRLWGHDPRTASDGKEALETAAAFRPQLVLLDLGLPGIDGFEVARRLRRETAEWRPLIVAMSGYAGEVDRRRSREAGCDLHLAKPADPDDIRKLLTFQDLNETKDFPHDEPVPSAVDLGRTPESCLRASPFQPPHRVDGECRAGVLTLTGHLHSSHLKQATEEVVAGIHNQIEEMTSTMRPK